MNNQKNVDKALKEKWVVGDSTPNFYQKVIWIMQSSLTSAPMLIIYN